MISIEPNHQAGISDQPDGFQPPNLSPSGIKSYLSCPAKYYYERVLKIKLPTSAALFIGSCVHAALASLHRSQMRGEPMSKQAVLAEYGSVFRQKLEEDKPAFTAKQPREKILELGTKMVDAFMDSKLASDERRSLGVEIHMEEDIMNDAPPLQGILDLVKEDPGGEIVITDIKTTATTPDLKLEAWLNEIQLVAYAILMRHALGREANRAELWFLVKTAKPKVLRYRMNELTEVQFERFHSIYRRVVDGIADGDFSPRPSFACRFCDFRERCQQWKGGLPA
jgi:putative RecB family exonuclease